MFEAMNRRRTFLFGSALVLPLGAFAYLGCVGDPPVTPPPTGDGGPDVGAAVTADATSDVSNDARADATVPLLTCQPSETLETFDDPMGGSGTGDFCYTKT